MANSKNVTVATDANFETEVKQAKGLTLVDFWAEWCGPCRLLSPTIDALADENVGNLKVMKMNVDENPNTPSQFHIRGIPTVILFKNGQMVEQIVGMQPKDAFMNVINRNK